MFNSFFKRKKRVTLEEVFLSFMGRKKGRTREIYASTLSKLRKHDPDFGRMAIEDVTVEWLRSFDAWMEAGGLAQNSRCVHLRNIRAVYYSALNDEVVMKNPFRRFSIRPEATRKRSLTAAQLRRLIKAEIRPWQEKYRDAFLLMFCLRGINAVDLCKLTVIEGGRITYKRSKTGKLYDIKVEAKARELIRRLKGEKHLIYALERVKDYRTWNAQLNAGLQSIAKGIPNFPADITGYWARHTWASIAYNDCGVSKDVISQALGHRLGSDTTEIYLNRDTRLADRANRRVLRFVFGDSDDGEER